MTKRATLLIYAKPPRIGLSKTRLAKSLASSTMARRIASMTLARTLKAAASSAWESRLYLTPAGAKIGRMNGLARRVRIIDQGRGTLSDRLNKGLAEAPPGPVIFIGSDAPDINSARVRDAVRKLATHDAVYGPAHDGGFWLFGLNKSLRTKSPFKNIRWSGPDALADVLSRLPKTAKLAELETLIDIDDAQDLSRWTGDSRSVAVPYKPVAVASSTKKPKRGFFGWLFGKKAA